MCSAVHTMLVQGGQALWQQGGHIVWLEWCTGSLFENVWYLGMRAGDGWRQLPGVWFCNTIMPVTFYYFNIVFNYCCYSVTGVYAAFINPCFCFNTRFFKSLKLKESLGNHCYWFKHCNPTYIPEVSYLQAWVCAKAQDCVDPAFVSCVPHKDKILCRGNRACFSAGQVVATIVNTHNKLQ